MPVIEDLKQELQDATTLKLISGAFTEVSALKIKSLKKLFENNGQFYQEISELYQSIKISAAAMKLSEKIPQPVRGKGTLSVAVTSNHRFYGMLNIDVMRRFQSDTENYETDRLVIGLTGSEYLKSVEYKEPCDFALFKKEYPSGDEVYPFLEKVRAYEKILVYYPKFITLFSQQVDVVDITYSPTEREISEEKLSFIFEPELPNILEFFETQVRYLLFARVLLEAELSRTAARLLAMSAAEDRADDLIKEKRSQISRAHGTLVNARLLETFAGVKKWRRI